MEDNHEINARTWTSLDTVTATFYFLITCVFLAGCCLGAVGLTCYNKILELTQGNVVIKPARFDSHDIVAHQAPTQSFLNEYNSEQSDEVQLQGMGDSQYDITHH